nr:hypothetical protein [Tanacetum cinerariifolium]
MRTRSQSRNNFPQQEASPAIVEPLRIELPFLKDQFQEDPPEDPPKVLMADNRTIAELLQAPTEATINLQDQITAIIPQLEGHIKTNMDLSQANESLKAKLAQCKLEMQILECNKPTHTIPMLSKRPNIATSDLHKTALGSSNSKYGNIARESHLAIYDGNRLLDPTHVPSSVWETKETIALGAKSRAKMFEKPGTVKPINYDVLNNSYIKFVP